MRLILTSEVNRWHWAIRLSFDVIVDGYDDNIIEPTVTVALGPWVGCIGVRWYR